MQNLNYLGKLPKHPFLENEWLNRALHTFLAAEFAFPIPSIGV